MSIQQLKESFLFGTFRISFIVKKQDIKDIVALLKSDPL